MTRNRLQHERSPYLLQHAGNPVDWYPWGEEAFAKAARENKPVFLSIGYSACHWCHVMEHESFEDPATAAVLNQHFVNIKVDREERPDIDQVYQLAYQVMQRRGGGWPLSIFMTPEKQPFFGGTYFPPKRRYGMPGFSELLQSIVQAWDNKHDQVVAQGAEMARVLEEISLHTHHSEKSLPSPELLEASARELLARCDKHWGGFGTAPKFPNTMSLDLLLMAAQHEDSKAQDAFFVALARMAQGGIYDQLGGGFARYSVDERWLIPHFEKMLYDNAQLAKLYLDGYRYLSQHQASQLTQADCRRIVDETLTYLLREMTAPEGCFYSAQDADSEGEEGKFFVWTPREIAAVIGIDAAEAVCAYFDVTDEGNFEHGKSALWTPKPLSEVAKQLRRTEDELRQMLAEARPKLFAAREKRIKPMRDDKCLASWNGLAITAFVEAGATFGKQDWVEAAQKALSCWQRLAWRDGRLAHAIKDGEAYGTGYLDDYAGLGLAALSVFSCTGDVAALRFARELCDTLLDLFADKAHGDFFFTPHDAERVLHRPKESHDHAYPGGTGLTADLLLQLAALTGEPCYQEAADLLLHNLGLSAAHNPMGMSTVVRAVDRAARGSLEIILLGNETTRSAHRDIVLQQYIPHRVLVQLSGAEEGKEAGLASTLLAGRSAGADGKTTAYVCRGNLCEAPVQDAVALRELLQGRQTM